MKVKSAVQAMAIGVSVLVLGATAASAKGVTAPVLSQQIERAVVGAQSDARSQGLNARRTEALMDSAVSRVIAASGADAQTVTTALALSKQNLAARGQSSATVATVLDQAAGATTTTVASTKSGGGTTFKTAQGAGGSDYRGD